MARSVRSRASGFNRRLQPPDAWVRSSHGAANAEGSVAEQACLDAARWRRRNCDIDVLAAITDRLNGAAPARANRTGLTRAAAQYTRGVLRQVAASPKRKSRAGLPPRERYRGKLRMCSVNCTAANTDVDQCASSKGTFTARRNIR